VIVPGLLQTADYSRAMAPLIAPTLPDLDELVSCRFLLHESAVRARVASVEVMRGQLDRLTYLAAAFPHVEIRLLPFSTRLLDAWVMTPFTSPSTRDRWRAAAPPTRAGG
jgi:uncharacterized protein DUF5753